MLLRAPCQAKEKRQDIEKMPALLLISIAVYYFIKAFKALPALNFMALPALILIGCPV